MLATFIVGRLDSHEGGPKAYENSNRKFLQLIVTGNFMSMKSSPREIKSENINDMQGATDTLGSAFVYSIDVCWID